MDGLGLGIGIELQLWFGGGLKSLFFLFSEKKFKNSVISNKKQEKQTT